MASANGALSPLPNSESSTSSTTLSAKRKREDTIEIQHTTNGITHQAKSLSTTLSDGDSQDSIRDLIDVLKSYDTLPSILKRPIPERVSSLGPQAKRQKAEGSNDTQSSIMTRFSSNAYKSLDEVVEDVDSAVADIVDKLQLPNGAARNQYIPVPITQSETSMKVAAFKRRAHDLVRIEKAAARKVAEVSLGSPNAAGYTSNGSLGSNAFTQINASSDNKTVLTLYGNAPTPKQLFSSLQIPTKVTGEEKDIIQTLREAGLPSGITTTQIVPLQSSSLIDDKKRVPTLGELFPTPPSVPTLHPPKPSKIATTRSSIVGWYQPANTESLPRSASYFKQSISAGQWLDYGNAFSLQGTKRKQRERALSLGGTKASQVDVEPVESEAAKLDALFRSAYSSFTPTKDDAAAIAPVGTIDRLWWQQVGEKIFERLVENTQSLLCVATPELVLTDDAEEVDDVQKFEEAVTELEKDVIDPSLVPLEAGYEKSAEEKDVEEILQGISELLETLNSYQRIRHMSLNSSNRPAGLLSAPDTTSLGTPTKPSEPEQATYEILKSQLTLMIATLPPYAVAKLDPDRLADLSISTKIEVQMNDYKGVMEEDEAATRAKVAALTASSNSATPRAAPTSLHRAGSSSLYGNQYPPSRTGATANHQYYGSAQTPVRPPSNNLQRPPNTAQVPYQSQRPAAATPYRPTTYGTPTYPHQTPRPNPQPYAAAQPQYLHTPSAQPYMRPPGQSYQHIPQSAPQGPMNGRYTGQPSHPHQSQPSPNGMDYRYGNNANIPRQVSPQKPMYSPQPSSTQPRPYSTPTPSLPQERRPYPQNPMGQTPMMNGSTSQTPQPFAHQSTGLTNYSTFMTHEQQSSMMERQRAHLAQQQAAQQQARNAAQAAMTSPSKTQVNGSNPVAAGL